MKAAVYARYSTELQNEASIDDQVRICRERIEREGWSYVCTYADRAVSGASRLRAEYQKLLEDARHGRFDVVIAEALDRLSRDQEDIAHLYKHLSFAGVKLLTLSEGEISELHVGLSGTIGALYLKQLAEKTRRGLRGRVEQGRSGGGNSYGYEVVVGKKADGSPDMGGRCINLDQAKVVCRIYRLYADGTSPRTIARMLNSEGVPGPMDAQWSPSTINGNAQRGTGILNNEMYAGRFVWNRLRYLKDPSTGKRRSKLNPPEMHIIKEVPHLRIVPQDLWDAVKARQRSMSRETRPDLKRAFWTQQRPRYLLSGLMKCGVCGASFTKCGLNRFACAGARDRGTCTNRLTIRGDEVETSILEGLKVRLMDPALFEEFTREFVAEVNRQRASGAAEADAKRKRLDRIGSQITQLVDAIINGADARALNSRLKELEAEQARLETELNGVGHNQPLLHPKLATMYRQKVERLGDLFRDRDHGREAQEVLRSLIQEVRLIPNGGALTLDLKGDLAGILSLSDAAKRASESQATALQIKMVAGVGFEPTTFRL